MKKSLFFLSAVAVALLTASCNKSLPEELDLKMNPNPMTVVGGQVNVEVTGTFPEKKFLKNALVNVTPVLKYGENEEQEVVGETTTYVGEKVKENGIVINKKEGATVTQKFSCKYVPEMASSKLYLRVNGKVGKKVYDEEIDDIYVGPGMNATSQLADAKDNKGAVTPDKFQRVIQEMQEADIKFLIQQANLRNSETKSDAVKNLQAAIKAANDDENKAINKIEVSGYASPDGTEKMNESLAKQRQAASQKFLQKQMKKDKVDATIESNITAEDWDGFKSLMENSNIQDKDLVLRVLNMYSDPEERETQIKNLSAVYKNIADDILPELRRSRLILTTDLIGKSDEEIQKLAKEDAAQLSLEELLYAATLEEDANEKAKIYQKAIDLYPDDYRAYNNLGMIYFDQGNVAEARRCYSKALEIEPNNPDVNYNAAIAAMADGDMQKAEEYLGKAAGTSADLNAAMGTYYTMKGDYQNAKNAYGNAATNNAAVQQILNEDYAGARQTLANVQNPNATTSYLAAIVGARTNDREAVYSNLKTAIEKDASFKQKAQKDIEFAKFAEDEQFNAIVK
ncbi:MAG: tetratricopeptide repeat protein [Paludibacteraceae bacterium]|nr:tetratricopeptide repeat protein [Paludibacteraceae bacterium]